MAKPAGAPPTGANRAASASGGPGSAEAPATARPAAVMPLPPAEAHLWSAQPAAFADAGHLARLRAMLTDEERARTDCFRLARDRRISLVTRALVRVTLSRYCEVPPVQWRFRTNRHGRPEIGAPVSPLRFNVSHTRGLVVCLVGRERELGVDAECLDPDRRWLDLAARFFAPAEARALREVPAARRALRFLEYWTLKESYVKARGRGLTLPLSGFWFDLPARSRDGIGIRFTPAVEDDSARWQFTLDRVGAGHVVATAVARTGGARVRIVRYAAVARRGDGSSAPPTVAGRMVLDAGAMEGGDLEPTP